jgi:hypothetical protein
MTPDQIRLVQSTWQSVIPIQKQAATVFYEELFAADPSLRGLFKGNLEEQKSKLMKRLGFVATSPRWQAASIRGVSWSLHAPADYQQAPPPAAVSQMAESARAKRDSGAACRCKEGQSHTAGLLSHS